MTELPLKSTVRRVVASIYHLSGIYRARHRGKVLILTYHRVLTQHELRKRYVQPGMYVLDDVFEMHMRFIKEYCEVLSFSDLLARWETDTWNWERPSCVVTFDDGWLDNYRYAYPVLQKYAIPGSIFLPTDYIGTNEWFWPEKICHLVEQAGKTCLDPRKRSAFWCELHRFVGQGEWLDVVAAALTPGSDQAETVDRIIERCKALPAETISKLIDTLSTILSITFPDERMIVNWEEVKQMSRDGISFGSHSCSHRILTTLSQDETQREIEVSDRRLQEKHVNRIPVFCYPNGDSNQLIRQQVKEGGYRAAVGTRFGFEGERPGNLFELNRIGLHNDVTSTVPLLAFHILGPLS